MLVFPDVFVSGTISGGGISTRAAIRVATTVAGTLITSYVNGATVDVRMKCGSAIPLTARGRSLMLLKLT